MKLPLTLLIVSVLLTGCGGITNPPQTVNKVSLTRYAGTWYEIASKPNMFQRGCRCTKARYGANGDTISVTNSCYKHKDNVLSQVHGKAWPVPGSGNAKLKVQFFWPFKGDYWVLYLDKQYRYALVGTPKRNYLWILARSKTIPEPQYRKMLDIAKQQGFDVRDVSLTQQDSCHSN